MPIDIRQQIRQVGVLGAGTMGNGIAQAFAAAGYPVIMRDIKQEYVDRGVATIAKSLERLTARGKLPAEARDAALARIRPTTEMKDLAPCDLVVEAVLENFESGPLDGETDLFLFEGGDRAIALPDFSGKDELRHGMLRQGEGGMKMNGVPRDRAPASIDSRITPFGASIQVMK